MPYKRYEDFLAWNRVYQRRRSAQERRDRATVEGRIIDIVREQPRQHATLSLYEVLRTEGYPIRMVQKAVDDLLRGRVLGYDPRTLPPKLIVNELLENPFCLRKPLGAEEETTA